MTPERRNIAADLALVRHQNPPCIALMQYRVTPCGEDLKCFLLSLARIYVDDSFLFCGGGPRFVANERSRILQEEPYAHNIFFGRIREREHPRSGSDAARLNEALCGAERSRGTYILGYREVGEPPTELRLDI